MSISIRQACPDDSRGIAEVHVQAWKEAYKGVIHQTYLDTKLDLEERTRRWEESFQNSENSYRVFVAVDGEKIIGFSDIGASREDDMKDFAEIYAMYLFSSYLGQGIGHRLFNTCKQQAIDWGFKKLFVWVLVNNKLGRDFYDRIGGVSVSETEKTVLMDQRPYQEIQYQWVLDE